MIACCIAAFAQSVTLTFTAKDAANQHVQLNRVSITNLTKGWQETIYWPDTTLTMQNGTGIADIEMQGRASLQLSQNNPNPFTGTTEVSLMVAEEDEVLLDIMDVNGKTVGSHRMRPQAGTHQFRITLSTAGTYVMTARQNGQTSSIKMVCNGGGDGNRIEYTGNGGNASYATATQPKSGSKYNTSHPFTFGDQMEYVGYATINGTEAESQRIMQAQGASQTFTLQFAETQTQVQLPTVTTSAVSNITSSSATAGGTVISDGGATVFDRGVCYSTASMPTVSDNCIHIGQGIGAFSSNITGLNDNTTYYVRAYATSAFGTVYGNEVCFTTGVDGLPCPGAATVTDIDGNTYNTVLLGNQCWMKENLRTTRYANGVNISMGSTYSYTDPYRYAPENDSSNVPTYGYLYNWPAVMHGATSSSSNPSGVQGICPNGWHVPSDAEWTQLTNYVGSQTQYQCNNSSDNIAKALAYTTRWTSSSTTCAVGNNPSTNNATGFSALPAGGYGAYYYFGFCADFWSATQEYSNIAYYRNFLYDNAKVGRSANDKNYGFSVRCVSNETSGGGETSATLPTVATANVSDITTTSVTCGGNVTADGGATVTARGICWSTSQIPTISDSHTTNGTGTGSFTSNITGLTPGAGYYVRAYATNSEGTAYGNEEYFITPNPNDGQQCSGTATVTDYDNNTYNTVQIGNQCWMKENLRTTHYSNGTSIALGSYATTSIAYRYYPNNNSSNVSTYGYLYNWKAVMGSSSSSSANPSGVQGICPNGWHVPSNAEWTQLTNYVGSQPQFQCDNSSDNIAKALASTTGWGNSSSTCAVGNNPSTNNATVFSALPAGYYSYDLGAGASVASGFGNNAYFWSATEYLDRGAYCRNLYYNYHSVGRDHFDESFGFSVRCVRDETSGGGETSVTLPTVATANVSDITTTSVTCGGNVTTDGGATVTARGVCWSISQNPTVSDSHTTDGSGMGSFTSSITGLTAVTTYYVRAYATNNAGTSYGEQRSFTTAVADGDPCPGAATVIDYDNNTYNTVKIGNQCWMKENLRTTHYADGVNIPIGSTYSDTDPYRYAPDNNSSNVSTYGYLYNWPAVMHGASSSSSNPSGVQGICPDGWHVPSDAEWTQLTNYVGSQSQYQCNNSSDNIAKALASTTEWYNSSSTCAVGNNPSTNNATGFLALPAGDYYYGSCDDFGYDAYFWSVTEYNVGRAYWRRLYYDNANVGRSNDPKGSGLSVRCVRD